MVGNLRALNGIAQRRGQTLAQLALAWALRDERVTSLVIGASSVESASTSGRTPARASSRLGSRQPRTSP